MECPNCKKETVSRVDTIMVEMFGYCWTCGHTLFISGKITEEEFRRQEQEAINKKYEK